MIKRPKDQQRQTGSSGILPKQWDKEPQQDGQSSAPRTELASPPPRPPNRVLAPPATVLSVLGSQGQMRAALGLCV